MAEMVDARRLLATARELQDEMTALCAELVRTPSVNGRDPEAGVVAVLERAAERFGLPTRRFEAAPGRPTLLIGPLAAADASGANTQGGLLLVGHTDTVPEGDHAAWQHPPFAARIDGGRLYGRGACDNKGGIAAGFFALVVLQRAGLLDASAASLLCVPDEESGASGTLGITPALRDWKLHAQGAIYTYPGMHEIPIGHRGLLRLTITAHGQSLHSGSRDWQERRQGANAVLALADALLQLEELDRGGELDANLPPRSAAWGEWRTVMTPGTTFAGGSGQSIVPDRASAIVDVRLVEGVTHGAVIARARRVLDAIAARRERITFDLHVDSQLPPTSIPADAAVVQAVRAACQALLGTQPPLVIAGPANEGYLLNAGAIPTICGFGPVGEGGHAPDEWVEVASLPLAAALYADTATRMGNR